MKGTFVIKELKFNRIFLRKKLTCLIDCIIRCIYNSLFWLTGDHFLWSPSLFNCISFLQELCVQLSPYWGKKVPETYWLKKSDLFCLSYLKCILNWKLRSIVVYPNLCLRGWSAINFVRLLPYLTFWEKIIWSQLPEKTPR